MVYRKIERNKMIIKKGNRINHLMDDSPLLTLYNGRKRYEYAVYVIWSNFTDMLYIGCTKTSLSKRLNKHYDFSTNSQYIIGYGDAKMTALGFYDTKEEVTEAELRYIYEYSKLYKIANHEISKFDKKSEMEEISNFSYDIMKEKVIDELNKRKPKFSQRTFEKFSTFMQSLKNFFRGYKKFIKIKEVSIIQYVKYINSRNEFYMVRKLILQDKIMNALMENTKKYISLTAFYRDWRVMSGPKLIELKNGKSHLGFLFALIYFMINHDTYEETKDFKSIQPKQIIKVLEYDGGFSTGGRFVSFKYPFIYYRSFTTKKITKFHKRNIYRFFVKLSNKQILEKINISNGIKQKSVKEKINNQVENIKNVEETLEKVENNYIKKIKYKKPTKITKFPVTLKDQNGIEQIIAYAKDNYHKKKFMATQKYNFAQIVGWEFKN